MQLHAHMLTCALPACCLLACACAPCSLILALAFGGQGHAGATQIPGRTYGITAAPKAAWCCSLLEMARAK